MAEKIAADKRYNGNIKPPPIKPPETDSFIALWGTIYSTSMYSRTDADNTRGDILDAANECWCFKKGSHCY
jgi:hypothetical protein